jgi:DNA-binding transcriptional regulator YdaS (Cro superfamily)
MDINAVITHFGGVSAMAARLGVTRMAVYQWKKAGVIPFPRQAQIELETGGTFTTRRKVERT